MGLFEILFWQIMETLFGIGRHLPYEDRIDQLIRHRIALWDVIGACRRQGNADDRIAQPSLNPVGELLASYPTIRIVAFNGKAAGRYGKNLRLPDFVRTVPLPSTSPANTRCTLTEKVKRWGVLRDAGSEIPEEEEMPYRSSRNFRMMTW